MSDILLNFFQSFTNNGKLITLIISMFPLIELKGAIPIGTLLLGENALLTSALLGYIGSSFICIPIFFLLIPIFNLLKKIPFIKKVVEKIESVLKNKAEKLAKNSKDKAEDVKNKMLILGLFIFVAVPFPVTGVWTGTAIAVFLNLSFKQSFLPLILGNLVAGTIITLLTFLFKDYVDIIITVLFIIAILMLILFIYKIVKSKPHNENNN
ncbi:MAG: small multi-drug export protein [Clostridia bacterium]|nr:small multi-drug export protein [Clostridia bacterium]